MIRKTDFFIDGRWVAPTKPHDFEVINPADAIVDKPANGEQVITVRSTDESLLQAVPDSPGGNS